MDFIKPFLALLLFTCFIAGCNESNQKPQPLPGMPAVREPTNIYADANTSRYYPCLVGEG